MQRKADTATRSAIATQVSNRARAPVNPTNINIPLVITGITKRVEVEVNHELKLPLTVHYEES